MYFNVAQLLKEPTGATRTYDLVEDLSDLDPELAPLNPLVGTLHLLRTHSGILVSGELSTALRITCNRCLGPVALPVRFQLEESFRPLTEVFTGRYIHPDEFEGSAEDLEDAALLINEQHILNISEVVRQNIWLTLPMYPTCEDAGLEECPHFQERLEALQHPSNNSARGSANDDATGGVEYIRPGESPSGLSSDTIDPRWAALLELKSQLDERSINDADGASRAN